MQDRIPLYPGRVKMTPVAGQANTFDMVRADEPTQTGTPLNKATFLKDATAALYGLGTGSVPDNVLAELGKYKQYWWKRRVNVDSSHYVENVTTVAWSGTQFKITYRAKRTIYYSDSYTVDSTTGAITLDNQQSVTCSDDGSFYAANPPSLLLGKWCLNLYEKPTEVVYIPADATIKSSSNSSGDTTVYLNSIGSYNKVDVTFVENSEVGDWGYVQSSNRNAYQDSGTQAGYEYEYLGIPFDNAVTAPRIETGSYVGTGTSGASNPNTLTFGFIPKLVIIKPNSTTDKYHFEVIQGQTKTFSYQDNTNYGKVETSWDGSSISWYCTSDDGSEGQLNKAEYTYYYFAIG